MFAIFLYICTVIAHVSSHARFIEPPSRASAWRFGFNTPADYDDNGNNCGGLSHQYHMNDGKCGICGDPWDQKPRAHETGGIFATGVLVRNFTVGEDIEATVDVTSNHLGHMEFSLCPVKNPSKEVTQECLDRYKLYRPDGEGPKHKIDSHVGEHRFKLRLPKGMSCDHCVIQWKYIAGNNWNMCEDGRGALGCGQQEEFRACADISISDINSSTSSSGEASVSTTAATTTPRITSTTHSHRRPNIHGPRQTQAPPSSRTKTCTASRSMRLMRGLDQWCTINCNNNPPFCPISHCICN